MLWLPKPSTHQLHAVAIQAFNSSSAQCCRLSKPSTHHQLNAVAIQAFIKLKYSYLWQPSAKYSTYSYLWQPIAKYSNTQTLAHNCQDSKVAKMPLNSSLELANPELYFLLSVSGVGAWATSVQTCLQSFKTVIPSHIIKLNY
jgi:hypothetical protein